MNRDEAVHFIAELKKGRRFYRRFQESEWGMEYRSEENKFHKWSRMPRIGGGPTDTTTVSEAKEILSETELMEQLIERYRLDIMMNHLVD